METTVTPASAKSTASWSTRLPMRIILLFMFYAIAPTTFFFIAWSKRADDSARHEFYTNAHYVMFVFILLVGMYAWHQSPRWQLFAGFRKPKYGKPFWLTLLGTIVAGLVVYVCIYPLIKEYMDKQPPQPIRFYLMYVCFSCAAQAFLYIAVIYAEFKIRGLSDRAFIICSAINFAYLHVFYLSWVTLGLTFVAGLGWAVIYSRYRDIMACIISHILLGMLTIVLGMI